VKGIKDVFVVAGDRLRIGANAMLAHQRVLSTMTGNEESLKAFRSRDEIVEEDTLGMCYLSRDINRVGQDSRILLND